jgi:hypothetical protein
MSVSLPLRAPLNNSLYAQGFLGSLIDRADHLLELARRRQATRWLGYKGIGDYHGGVYECDFVSPYTKSAGNVDASLMILLQDWASDAVLGGPVLQERVGLGHDPTRHTNRRLKELLRRHFQMELSDVFATNVFPFVKPGPMGEPIPKRDLVKAAREFAISQIEIIKPVIAVCLGKTAFNAVAVAAGDREAATLADAIAKPFQLDTTEVWCQRHPGRNGVDRVGKDWARMASVYNSRLLDPHPNSV